MFEELAYINSLLIENRTIENINDEYWKTYENVVLTCYMTSKKDPQRNIYQNNNNYEYIKPWYESMKERKLHGIIFYDLLSDEFVNTYQTDKIIFKKCKIGQYSINDERFIIYYKYLLKNKYKYVLMTDISDVIINRDPFVLMKDDKYNNDNNRIFVGTNTVGMGAIKRTPMWFERRKWKIDPFNEKLKKNKYDDIGYLSNTIQIYSAGLLGGDYGKIMWFLSKTIEIMLILHSEKNYNMIIFNYIINRYLLEGYDDKTFLTKYIYTGGQFNSLFAKNEINYEGCLIHK